MGLQEQIDSFQRMIFAHFGQSVNNECRISALVPLVKESWGIYRFITSMLRAMHRRMFSPHFSIGSADGKSFKGTDDHDALEPLRGRYASQHHNLRKFYYECSNLKYLTGLINVPKLAQVRVIVSFSWRSWLRFCTGTTESSRQWRRPQPPCTTLHGQGEDSPSGHPGRQRRRNG